MSHEKLHELLNYILISAGAAGAATVTFWQNIDLGLSIFLKIISLISFVCYLLINQNEIEKGYISRKQKIINYFKSLHKEDGKS